MPGRRESSSGKRKAPAEDESSTSPKVAKVTESATPEKSSNSQPTNKVLPTTIVFPPRTPGALRLATWNICGLAASHKKGFRFYVEAEDPDILVLTETKVNDVPADPLLNARFPHSYWSISDKKTYAGTAVLCKHKPLNFTRDLPGHPDPPSVKGRIITLEFEGCYVIGTYVINAGEKLKTINAKMEWNFHFERYIQGLDKKKPVIWAGDMNVAPTSTDLCNAKKNWNKTPGYTEAETESFKNILDPPGSETGARKFVDIWRRLHPDDQHYTYFSYRFNCRAKGIGWRLDMFVLSERMISRVKMCEIRSEIYGASDHCPVVMEIEGEL